MPTNLLARMLDPRDAVRRLDSTYPPFLAVFLQGLADCQALGRDYWVTRLFSTDGEQQALYNQGRTVERDAKTGAKLRKVTNARGGESAHCFGLGADVVYDVLPFVAKLQPGYDVRDYAAYVEVMETLGLRSGYRYGDWPHCNWPGYETAVEMAPLRAARATRRGLVAVWEYLDAERATPAWQAAHPGLHRELMRLGYAPDDGTLPEVPAPAYSPALPPAGPEAPRAHVELQPLAPGRTA